MSVSVWLGRQKELGVVAPALLVGAPAALAAAQVNDLWALGGAAMAALDFGVQGGCLALAGGKSPVVGEIPDPVLASAHRAQAPDSARPGEAARR
jgi:hypothetical protein